MSTGVRRGAAMLMLVLGVGLAFSAAAARASTQAGAPPTAFTRVDWRQSMHQLATPAGGCFVASYPAVAWQRTQCTPAPHIPFAPSNQTAGADQATPADGPAPQTIGNGYDYMAQAASGSISTSTGSFPYISPGSTETGTNYETGDTQADTYTLQLNTNFISGSPACDTASVPGNCQAWQQFIYSSTYGGVFMQYWLIDYNNACPAGFYTYSNDCYTNSNGTLLPGAGPTAAQLESTSLTASAVHGGSDTVEMAYGNGTIVADSNADTQIDLAGTWKASEFVLVGDGNGTAANFSSGTTLDVKTTIDNGAAAAPTCLLDGTTGETNNLSFAAAPTLASGPEPAIETAQTSSGGTAGCAAAGESAAPPPTNTHPPVVSGTLQVGSNLTVSTGTWTSSSSLSHAYQWFSCTSSAASSCTQIAGATHSTFTLTSAQLGDYVAAQVTVTDQTGGSAHSLSATRGPVAAPAPVATSTPSITGTAQDGHTLTAHRPTFTDPVAMTYSYAWYTCANQTSSGCQVIPGQTSYTLKLTSAQVGDYVEAVMTANASGSTTNATAFTASKVAAPAAPVNTAAPKISGGTSTGAKATTTNGTWTSPDTLTYTYQWYRCTSSAQSSCTAISGARSNYHTRVAADSGDKLAVKVTATDAEGQASSVTVVQS